MSVAPPPSTPRKKRPTPEELHRTIRSLSDDFLLHLRIPDPNLSPSRRKLQRRSEEQERVDAIFGRAQYLHFKDPSRLSICIEQFRIEAKELRKKWVSKPNPDPGTRPRSSDPPRSGSKERAALQTLLLKWLRDVDTDRPRTRWSKRPSDEFPDPNAKRPRGFSDQRHESPGECVDEIPVRTKTATGRPDAAGTGDDFSTTPGPPSVAQSQSFSYMSRSAISSRLSFAQSVFSGPVEGNRDSTQTTVAFNDSHKGTQDSYPACTQEYEALNESFSKYDQDVEPPEPQYQESELPEPERTQPFLTQVHDVRIPDHQVLGSEGTAYSSIPEMEELDIPTMDAPPPSKAPSLNTLDDRLKNIWPKFPLPGLNQAPLIILWEITRAAIHCDVNLKHWDIEYKANDAWHDQDKFRGRLSTHHLFLGKGLPQRCDSAAWAAGLSSFSNQDKAVTLAAELLFSSEESGPLFQLKLQPPRLELGHRLSRRLGADRFIEIIMPSPTSRDVPAVVKYDDLSLEKIVKWISDKPHYFMGRSWSTFFTRSQRKSIKDPDLPNKTRNISQQRIYLFAIDGIHFRSPPSLGLIPPPEEATHPECRTKMRRCDLLNWALDVRRNANQTVHKLFARLAISLSRTWPTVVLEHHQIRNQKDDIGIYEVMNDGIGRMSRSLARKVAARLCLSEVPCAYQGRLGSAKGMWLIDVNDDGLDENDWIETFPSQRKWECDSQDIHHRTLEVRSWPMELRTASLNQQFIPVLEAQSPNPLLMRQAIANHLRHGLRAELDDQVAALNHPMDLRAWMQKAGFTSGDRNRTNIALQAGLPDRDEDTVAFLLDAGFEANKNEYLRQLVWALRKRQVDQLKAKLNVKIPRSAYAFMVIDFTGALEEGEAHFAFSNKFQVDGESETLLDGIDILVARAPAHFVSDVQKVKVVFKPSLKRLKDVIIFSSKGKSPLADLLSGGDYDGDLAWVCWDRDIVQNFRNATKPPEPDLTKYVRKDTLSFQWILDQSPDLDSACTEWLHKAVHFSMQPSMLGICTTFKEKLCYFENSVNSERAITLSALVGLLVDQSKQGTLFTWEDFGRLKKDMNMKSLQPEYEKERPSKYVKRDGSVHILDHLKFDVAYVVVDEALASFSQAIGSAEKWDKDLTWLYDELQSEMKSSRTSEKLMKQLIGDIKALDVMWKISMAGRLDGDSNEFVAKLSELYQNWLDIKPPKELMASKKISGLLDVWNGDSNLSKWSLLKASTMFKLNYNSGYKMVWRVAGWQLAWIKAMRTRGAGEVSAVPVKAEMWNVLRPDNSRITTLAARRALGQDNESVAAIEEVTEYDDNGTQIDDV
ncbi:Fc.00g107690.m01.CDS01 [Cosmosporella sp. VM-42]